MSIDKEWLSQLFDDNNLECLLQQSNGLVITQFIRLTHWFLCQHLDIIINSLFLSKHPCQLYFVAKIPYILPGIILCMRPANEKQHYNVTSLIGTQNDPW